MLILKRMLYALALFVIFLVAISISNFQFFDPVLGHMDALKRDQPDGSKAYLSLQENTTQLVALQNDESGLGDDAWRCSMLYHELRKGEYGYQPAIVMTNLMGL